MTLAVGIVGWGEIARDHARQFERAGARLAGVVSRRSDLALGVPVYPSLDRMLPHVDALTVAVPNHLHAGCCLQAVRAGKPVLVEKPLLIGEEELAQLEALLPSAGVPVHVGYRLRWNPSMRELRRRIRRPRRIECLYRFGIETLAEGKPWTRRFACTGGAFFTLGIHALDLVRWLARAGGAPFSGLRAEVDGWSPSVDYPLRARVEGTLPDGTHLVAGTDTVGSAACDIRLRVDAEHGRYPDDALPPPMPADESVEYEGLIANFVTAARTGTFDRAEIEEILETHRELLWARKLAGGGAESATDADAPPAS